MARASRLASVLGAVSIATAVVGIATWYGCSIYDSSLLLPLAGEGGPDTTPGGDAGTDAPPEAANPCPEVFPPSRPTTDDPSDAGDQSFVVALHTLDLGVRPDGGPPPLFGYDLDDVSTCCEGQPESCKAVVAGAQHCDEDGGRDNSGGQLISSFALIAPGAFNSDTISQRLQDGVYSLIVQVTGYNGQPNDSQVVAALYASTGTQGVGEAGPPLPKWDGTDVWTIDQAFVLSASPIIPNHFDAHAYVRNGVLVVAVDFPISLGAQSTGSITLALTGGVITATVVPVGNGTYKMENGQVAGRWSASSVLQSVQGLNFAGSTICPGSSTYAGLKQQICHAADISSDPSADKTGVTCDALSVAFGYTADPAQMGDVVASSGKSSPCGDGGPDAAPDDCTTP